MTGLRELVEAVREARDAMSSPEDDAYGASLKRRLREKRLREAEAAAVDAITPDVLAAVEAVRRLGHWRNVLAVIDPNSPLATVSIVQARTERDRAYESLEQLADRLAARKGE